MAATPWSSSRAATGHRSSSAIRIEGAPLISRLLSEGKARYVCAVSSPVSSYRRTHVSHTESHSIRWDENDLGEPPLFTPMIVCVAKCDLKLSEERDGVHGIWDQQMVTIETGSRLALGHVVQLRSSILQLLSLQIKKDLSNGEFFVDPLTEQGFQFRVNLSPGPPPLPSSPTQGRNPRTCHDTHRQRMPCLAEA